MLTNTIIERKPITLYEVIHHLSKDNDIADNIFDFVVYFYCNKDFKGDYYDKLMTLFALNIKVVSTNKDYTICDITGFIDENRKIFDKFMNEENGENYQPKNYKHIDTDDELFYDIYLMTFESLVVGNYSDKDYEKLYKMLGGK